MPRAWRKPLRRVGYEVSHQGDGAGRRVSGRGSLEVLNLGGPVVLCGTIRALGTSWARKVVNAANRHSNSGVRVFVVQMEPEADVEAVAFDEVIVRYWRDRVKAVQDLLDALQKYYPLVEAQATLQRSNTAEQRYRELLLETCDIINLANLPEQDRHITQRQLELRRLICPYVCG